MGTPLSRMPFVAFVIVVLTATQANLPVWSQSADAPQQEKDADEVKKMIKQLGSPKFAEREAASQRLEKIGQPALANLRKAAQSKDLEITRRAKELIRIISPEVPEAPWEKLLTEGINEERTKNNYKKPSQILT